MFEIKNNDLLLGTSKLEGGDPPMGCVEGLVTPSEHFTQFAKTNLPENDGDPAIKRWTGLRICTSKGLQLQTLDVVLMEIDFGTEVELRVDVLGIPSEQYKELFPNHCRAYDGQFK